jgi:hypothetical protein
VSQKASNNVHTRSSKGKKMNYRYLWMVVALESCKQKGQTKVEEWKPFRNKVLICGMKQGRPRVGSV